MPQLVRLRSGYEEELAVVLTNNNALRSLYRDHYSIYKLLVQFYDGVNVAIEGDARTLIIDKHLVEVVGTGIQAKKIVREIIKSSGSGSAYLTELPYNKHY